ncbi:MFS transporter [Pelagicoccus sp. NFK12]|uniref:MFS transporter n=1 Tax=Pelagicoccus enzymogenes TaxID=2773457 RepID=A0A927IG86_9BACT|nr:MFS transporter [Pelagicoccus enzymogenes]MBD5780927.1 MFS transporter [Pelagicoccus enzymogenes]
MPETNTPKTLNKPDGNLRWVICSLLFFSVAINYLDRLTISVLKTPLSEQFGWSNSDYGYITGAFSFAYAFGYLFGGRLSDRWGVKKALPYFVGAWSLFAGLHGLCAFLDLDETITAIAPEIRTAFPYLVISFVTVPMTAAGFIYGRIALGLCQGGNFPAAIKTVAEWFPVRERATATGWFNAGSNVGAVACPFIVSYLYAAVGFQLTFYITGAVGLVWVIAWKALYRPPEEHPKLSPSELAYIRDGQPESEEKPPQVPWISLLGYRAAWAYLIASILAGPAWGFYQFFVPDFLQQVFSLDQGDTAKATASFFLVATAGGVLGGWFAGKLLAKGWSLNKARKTALLVCALCVVPIYFAPFVPSVWMAIAIVGIAGSAHQGWSANLFSVVGDTMPREAISSVVGMGGFAAYMTGGFVNIITGAILDKTGSYISVFAYFSGMYILSLIAIQILVPVIGRKSKATN